MTPDTVPEQKVILRPLAAEDAPDLYAVLSDPAVARYTPLPVTSTLDATLSYIALCQSHAAIGSLHSFAVAHASAPSRLLGVVSASRLSMDVELGCALAQAHWGQRTMTIAMGILLNWVAQHAQGRRAWGTCDVEHLPARQMMEALGFTIERELPSYRVHPALGPKPRDCLLYSRRMPAA